MPDIVQSLFGVMFRCLQYSCIRCATASLNFIIPPLYCEYIVDLLYKGSYYDVVNTSLIQKCWVCGGNIPDPIIEKLGTPIAELGLSTRARNCLKRGGIEYAEEILKMEIKQVFRLRNFGIVTLNEIKEKLKAFGFEGWQ